MRRMVEPSAAPAKPMSSPSPGGRATARRCHVRRCAEPRPMSQPNPAKSFPVSWDQFHRDARALAWRLADKGPFEAIVCITRGGLVPAAIVARELGLRLIETVCVASYDYQAQGGLQVLKPIAPAVQSIGNGRG